MISYEETVIKENTIHTDILSNNIFMGGILSGYCGLYTQSFPRNLCLWSTRTQDNSYLPRTGTRVLLVGTSCLGYEFTAVYQHKTTSTRTNTDSCPDLSSNSRLIYGTRVGFGYTQYEMTT